MTARSEGNRKLSYMIRDVLEISGKKKFIVLEDTLELEKITFDSGGVDEIDKFKKVQINLNISCFQRKADIQVQQE